MTTNDKMTKVAPCHCTEIRLNAKNINKVEIILSENSRVVPPYDVFPNERCEDIIEAAESTPDVSERASLWCHIRLSKVDMEGIIDLRNKMLHFMGYCEDESG